MVNEEPLVSIVMNCYNGEKYLKEAIDSIYDQSYKNWEIIFWDNLSTDNSASIAKNYDQRLKYFLAEKTTSLGKARNLAMKQVNGRFVAFLDCDDLFLPDKIRLQLAKMQVNRAVLSYGSWIKINEEGEEVQKYIIEEKPNNKFDSLYSKYIVNFQTLMIDNHYLKENNLSFDENLTFSMDHNLVLRVAYKTPVMSIDDILAKYRVHSNAMSIDRKADKYDDLDYTMRFFESIGVQGKFKNFRYIALKAKFRMLLADSFKDRNYKEM